MKKIIYGTAVAVAAMFSACETLVPQKGDGQQKDEVIVTATIGADTKTFLEWDGEVFKTRWSEDDEIFLFDRDVDYSAVYDYEDYCGEFEIINGIGESTAEFVLEYGVMPERYIAVYSDYVWPDEETGQLMIYLPRDQYRCIHEAGDKHIQGFEDYVYPMAAIGEGKEVQFKNICSVFKINVAGNGEVLEDIVVSSLDEGVYLAGEACLGWDEGNPYVTFAQDNSVDDDSDVCSEIMFDPSVWDDKAEETVYPVLSEVPIECYIVLPAQNYPSGLKIRISTDVGFMEFTTNENLTFNRSELREIPTIEYESAVSYEGKWRLQSEGQTVFMDKDGDYYVAKDFYYDGDSFSVVYGTSDFYSVVSDEYYFGAYINSCAQLEKTDDEEHIRLDYEGYYDIYLDAENNKLFVMSTGVTPEDIPTKDVVAYHSYDGIRWNEVEDGETVKIRGTVVAECGEGYMVSFSYYNRDPILVAKDADITLTLGDVVDLYATKSTSRGLPMLQTASWVKVIYHNEVYQYAPENITGRFEEGYSSDYYSYIAYYGELKITDKGYYDVYVGDNTIHIGSIFHPIQDLSEYDGKKVLVEGYFVGLNHSGERTFVQTILTNIMLPNTDGSTEDVIPDDDIVLSTL